MAERDVYWRRARFVRQVDGDTVDVVIDVGFLLTTTQRLRLLGINTPELHSSVPAERAAAQAASTFARQWFDIHLHTLPEVAWPFNIRTEKSDAFGRYLAYVECEQGHSLTQDLLDGGYAVPFMVPRPPRLS